MVGDVLSETQVRVDSEGVETIDEVRSCGRQLAGFSASLAEEERGLKRFLYERVYNAPELLAVRNEALRVVGNLARAYRADPSLLDLEWRSDDRVHQVRRIGDFIAGMTDRFALKAHEELVGRVELPDRF
jgi:dGTPase